MLSPIDSAIATHVSGFTLGRFDLMTDCYAFPLPIYHGGDILILKNREDLMSFLGLYRDVAMGKPMADVEPAIIDDEVIDANHQRLTIEWRVRYDDGEVRRNRATRYLYRIDTCLKVVMVENHRFDFGGPFENLQRALGAEGVTLQ